MMLVICREGSFSEWTYGNLTHMQEENSSKKGLTLAITNFLIIDRVGLWEEN